ncbi:hypothetical protein F5Y19DRAFT_488675 [Xylariaceae sp. FL1651]|nr:hypothetical protein F5Y19DRAFT_488675 [Xylariaceae sp. FL1651]
MYDSHSSTTIGPYVPPSPMFHEMGQGRSRGGLMTRASRLSASTATVIASMNYEIALRWYHDFNEHQPSSILEPPAQRVSDHANSSYSSDSVTRIDPPLALSPISECTSAKSQALSRSSGDFSWWWWLEVGSLILSLTSKITLLGFLVAYNSHALADWPLPLQPNTVISILTTTMKATILLSISTCFSQLKWHHFRIPRRLNELQTYDEASRGPWGSLIILLRARDWLTVGLAIVTLTSLLIEATAQQILVFPPRETLLKGEDAGIVIAYEFSLNGGGSPLSWDWGRNIGFQSTIFNAATGNVSPFGSHCPDSATRCTYLSCKTLGICSSFRNLTGISTQSCAHNGTTRIDCKISWPHSWDGVLEEWRSITMRLNYTKDLLGGISNDFDPDVNKNCSDVFKVEQSYANMTSSRGPYYYINGARLPLQSLENLDVPSFEGFECIWYWCAQTYDASEGSSQVVTPELIDTKLLISTEPDYWDDSMEYCIYTDNSSSLISNLGDKNLWFLFHAIQDTLSCKLVISGPYKHGISYTQAGQIPNLALFLLYNSDLEKVVRNVATEISNAIRIKNRQQNSNTTTVKGYAFGTETYIDVRWEWVLLPVVETVLTVVLLVATIIVTKRSHQPLLKSSVNGLLFQGLKGWTAADTARQVDGKETPEKLDDISKSFEVRFHEDQGGRLRFLRT